MLGLVVEEPPGIVTATVFSDLFRHRKNTKAFSKPFFFRLIKSLKTPISCAAAYTSNPGRQAKNAGYNLIQQEISADSRQSRSSRPLCYG
jgi:hypothetical protein